MADPVTGGLAAISIGSSIFGGIQSAQGASASGAAQQSMYNYQAGIAQINKQIALQNADYSRKVGEVGAQVAGMQGRNAVGSARVTGAASGLDINRGSKADVIASTEAIAEQNQAVVRADAAKRAFGYESEATQQEEQSNLYTMAGANSKAAGDMNAMSSIIGTAGSVSGKWFDASKAGIFSSSKNPVDVGSATSFVS